MHWMHSNGLQLSSWDPSFAKHCVSNSIEASQPQACPSESSAISLESCALHNACWFCVLWLQCIVAAELVALAGHNGIKCGGAMLRDVGVYCLAIISVFLAFALGQVSCLCMSRIASHVLIWCPLEHPA